MGLVTKTVQYYECDICGAKSSNFGDNELITKQIWYEAAWKVVVGKGYIRTVCPYCNHLHGALVEAVGRGVSLETITDLATLVIRDRQVI